jgi:hypothetical protein
MNRVISISLVTISLLSAFASSAQELEPRRYVNLPIGQNFVALAYSYSTGDVNFSPSVPIEDAALVIDGPAFAYIRTFGLAGKSASVDFLQPYVCIDGSALSNGERIVRQTCGLADFSARISYNFFGAPAISLSEFGKRPRQTVVGVSLKVNAPTGAFDTDKLINIGANRWDIKPEIGVTIPWKKWSVEFAAAVHIFTDNKEFLETEVFEQDPLYNLQAHVHYDFSRRQSLSISSNYFFGGKTFRDGQPAAIRQANSRLGISWSYALNAHHRIKLVAHAGVITRIGNDSNAYTAAWSYRWD